MILLILIDIYYQIFSAKHDIEIDRELKDDSNGGLITFVRFG